MKFEFNNNVDGWSCLPVAVANSIGVPTSAIIDLIGHDGSDRPYPDIYGGYRRGFHVQECSLALIHLGYTVTQIERRPLLTPEASCPPIVAWEDDDFFFDLLRHSTGFAIGTRAEKGHAITNIKGRVVDPYYAGSVEIYSISKLDIVFNIDAYFMVVKNVFSEITGVPA